MKSSTKGILYGVGTFVFSIVAIVVLRSLIKGIDISKGFQDWMNWLVAAFGGVSAGWSAYSKGLAKEQQAEKEKKENQ